ncbi:hypothetical protein RFI_32282 [Reticulomyxa filosa]|uniref:Uncharacterized protein n=1 Tax=Reticulomyxa filosa TaxID=46433 RepID=X6LTZ1_RETFI|nr:hypothetical protein RFI_32282 [Reticulomyxa filosa]|eukprot:ETO05114.1 hypothetical protein RFI_32282 [Reticulomyxa filosa]
MMTTADNSGHVKLGHITLSGTGTATMMSAMTPTFSMTKGGGLNPQLLTASPQAYTIPHENHFHMDKTTTPVTSVAPLTMPIQRHHHDGNATPTHLHNNAMINSGNAFLANPQTSLHSTTQLGAHMMGSLAFDVSKMTANTTTATAATTTTTAAATTTTPPTLVPQVLSRQGSLNSNISNTSAHSRSGHGGNDTLYNNPNPINTGQADGGLSVFAPFLMTNGNTNTGTRAFATMLANNGVTANPMTVGNNFVTMRAPTITSVHTNNANNNTINHNINNSHHHNNINNNSNHNNNNNNNIINNKKKHHVGKKKRLFELTMNLLLARN